jgi:hypothetical protein
MCNLSEEIPDDEKMVRAIKSPHHLNKGKVKHNALRPPSGDSVVSVIRHAMGSDFCKDQGKLVVGGPQDVADAGYPPNDGGEQQAGPSYAGLLVMPTGHVRASGSTVEDAREGYFCGHAHIDHGMLVPHKGVPIPPELGEALRERAKAILKGSQYHADPAPDQPGWKGDPL